MSLFSKQCQFIAGAARIDQLPPENLPEIAFIGRSNVGKSSLLNALTGRKNLARTSQTPGRTQQINFFNLADQLILVDLPGYGYAKASKKAIKHWTELINHYLTTRSVLHRIYILIDARRGVTEKDNVIMTTLDDAAVPYSAVLTKGDKVTEAALAQEKQAIEGLTTHSALHPDVLCTSAKNAQGMKELQAAIRAATE